MARWMLLLMTLLLLAATIANGVAGQRPPPDGFVDEVASPEEGEPQLEGAILEDDGLELDAGTDVGDDEGEEDGGNDEGEGEEDGGEEGEEDGVACTKDHPFSKEGRTANLQTIFHEVNGTVKVLDDCTFEVLNFKYDGQGPDVFWYGAKSKAELEQGFIMRDLPSSHGPWDGTEEMVVKLEPEGVTWDDVPVLSVWCRAFGIDFGSADLLGDTREESADAVPMDMSTYKPGDAEEGNNAGN